MPGKDAATPAGSPGLTTARDGLPPPGRVVLVGAGPGDIELLTLKAARLIAEADFLVHDALVQPDVLALARHAQVIPVGKRAGNPSARQSSINEILLECARRGGLTVRLKGGDPLIFARAQEELEVLEAHGIPVEVVPGISTAQAAHAALAMPMTERGTRRALVYVTPQIHAPAEDAGTRQDMQKAANAHRMAGTHAATQAGEDAIGAGPAGNGVTTAPAETMLTLPVSQDTSGSAGPEHAPGHVPQPQTRIRPCPSVKLTPEDILRDPALRRWAEALVAAGSGSLYMAASVCHVVRDTLLAMGMPAETRATWMIDVSLPGETRIDATLATLQAPPGEHRGKPALLILGGTPHR